MLPSQSNSYVEATSVSAVFVVIDTSAMLHKEAAYIFTMTVRLVTIKNFLIVTITTTTTTTTTTTKINNQLIVNFDYEVQNTNPMKTR